MTYKEALIQYVELSMGIVPGSVWYLSEDIELVNPNRWNNVSEKEKRKFKRSFRKIVRKAKRKFSIKNKIDERSKHYLVKNFIISTLEDQIIK